jgi:hypothetical protein
MRGTSPSKKPRGGVREKDVQKCTILQFWGGSANVHEKKRAKREGLYFSEPANLYSTKNRFFSTQGIFFVFRAGRDTPRPKNKKGPVPIKVNSAFLYMRNQNFFYKNFFL